MVKMCNICDILLPMLKKHDLFQYWIFPISSTNLDATHPSQFVIGTYLIYAFKVYTWQSLICIRIFSLSLSLANIITRSAHRKHIIWKQSLRWNEVGKIILLLPKAKKEGRKSSIIIFAERPRIGDGLLENNTSKISIF